MKGDIVKTGFGLYHKKHGVLGVRTESNEGGDCCYSEQHILDYNEPVLWVVEDALTAGYVKHVSIEWFNACYHAPTHSFEPEDLEVVIIKSIVSKTEQPDIPSWEDYIRRKYQTPGVRSYNPSHAEFILREKRSIGQSYNLYDLHDLLRQEKEAKKHE